jgi:site-specific DNA recombinase
MGSHQGNPQVSAYLYLRQSKDVEGTRAAVDRQEQDARELCDRNGWAVADTYTDNDTSASSTKPRREYRRLLADVEHGRMSPGDVIVTWATDRLLRKITEMEELIPVLDRAGVRVVTVQAGSVDLSTADGRTLARMAAVIAQGEVEKKAARQRRQALQSAENGEAPTRRAFGYTIGGEVNGRDEDGTLTGEAAAVRRAFDMLLTDGASLVSITAYLASTGLLSVRGNPWSRKGTRYLLLSPRYAGWRVYHQGQEDEVRVRGTWTPLVTEEEHERAVALLTDPARRPAGHRGTARRWLGASLFRCGICGSDVRTGRRTTGQRSYICREHGHMTRAADPIDALVLDVITARLGRPDVADLLAGATPEVGELREQAAAIRRKIDRAVNDYADELIDAATLRTVKDRHGRALAVVERKIAAAARSSRLATLGTQPDPAAAFAAADLTMQREVIDALAVVVLLPSPRGTSAFRPESVRFDWR